MLSSKNSGSAFIIATVLQYVFQIILLLFVSVTQTTLIAIYLLNATAIILGAYFGSFKMNFNPFNQAKKTSPKAYLYMAITIIGTMGVGLALANFFVWVLQLTGYTYRGYSLELNTEFGIIAAIIVIAIVPSIGEEYLMRGVILSGLKRNGYVKAIVLSAFMFLLLHESPMQTVHQFLLGAVLAYAVLVTRSIWLGVFGHFLNNAISLGVSIYQENAGIAVSNEVTMTLSTAFILLAVLVVGGIVMFMGLWAFTRQIAAERVREGSGKMADFEKIVHEKKGKNGLEKMLAWFNKEDDNGNASVKREPLDINMWLAIGIGVALWIFNCINGYV